METKFLSDGRKVVVCGKINQTEYIVQEVFVTKDGSEIPSGENFTAKSLHDMPVESYAVRESRRLEDIIKGLKQERDKLDKDVANLKQKRIASAEWLKRNKFIEGNLPDFDWDYFCDVLMGNMKYAVTYDYSIEVYEFDKKVEDWENSQFDSLKAFNVSYNWNKEKGCKEYQFNYGRYSDNSGGTQNVKLCKDEKELQNALSDLIKEKFEQGRLSFSCLDKLSKYVVADPNIYSLLLEAHNNEIERQYKSALESANKILERKV